jgi:hypothetical protein
MTAPIDLAAARERASFVRHYGAASGAGRISAVADDVDTLAAEVERLRAAQAGTVRALADKLDRMARVGGSPPVDEAITVVARFVRDLADRAEAGSDVLDGAR